MKTHQQYRRKDRLVYSHPPTPITTSFSCPSPYYSAGSSPSSAEAKRLKLQRDFDNGFVDTEPYNFDFPVMPHAAPRTLSIPPHINLHRASEPASPVTIATTISSHSTPSPSPSGVIIMSDNDSQFFDDGYPVVVDQKQRTQHRRHTVEPSYASNTPSATRNQFSHNSFPIVMSQAESPYALNHFQAAFPADQSGTLNFSKLSQQQQHHQQQFLQAPMQEYMGGSPGDHTMGTMQQQCHSDEEELPALSPTGNPNHYPQSSRPSISENGLQSPTTPTTTTSPERNSANICGASVPGVSEDTFDFIGAWMDEYLHPDSEIHTPIPKLGRTVSDAMQDELFNPGIVPGMARTTPKRTVESRGPPSTFPNLFQQAQTQHAIARTASENPPINREHSPFRANSPFHPARHPFPPSPSRQTGLLPVVGFTARSQREQREKQDAAHALLFQMQGEYKNGNNSPKTISPKDAYLEYNENAEDEGVKGSLFASQEDSYSQNDSQNESSCGGGGSFSGSAHDEDEDIKTEQSFGLKTEESFGSMATSRRDSDVNMSFSTPVFTDNGNQFANFQATNYGYSGMTSEERSDDSQAVEEDDDESEYRSPQSPTPKKPVDSKANSGAYTCASPGCSQRFTTVTKMQKHRREAHGQTSPVSRDGMTSNVKAHHPGPHRCFRINPTTNKPCNTIFSRPYDLTRHEDTIHNTTREKVRCEICNDEKTFSRQDALTRHKKVKHGIDK